MKHFLSLTGGAMLGLVIVQGGPALAVDTTTRLATPAMLAPCRCNTEIKLIASFDGGRWRLASQIGMERFSKTGVSASTAVRPRLAASGTATDQMRRTT